MRDEGAGVEDEGTADTCCWSLMVIVADVDGVVINVVVVVFHKICEDGRCTKLVVL